MRTSYEPITSAFDIHGGACAFFLKAKSTSFFSFHGLQDSTANLLRRVNIYCSWYSDTPGDVSQFFWITEGTGVFDRSGMSNILVLVTVFVLYGCKRLHSIIELYTGWGWKDLQWSLCLCHTTSTHIRYITHLRTSRKIYFFYIFILFNCFITYSVFYIAMVTNNNM